MTETVEAIHEHPAPYSKAVLAIFEGFVNAEAERRGHVRLLDPFAGTGRIARLASPIIETVGVEIEPEWAACDPCVEQGDATALRFANGAFNVVGTSACFGNRMADTYDGRGACRACRGEGAVLVEIDGSPIEQECERCDGTGVDQSVRATYRIALGRMPSEGSAAVMQWGPAYRELHRLAIDEIDRVLVPDSLVLVNMKNHHRTLGTGEQRRRLEQHVIEWWIEAMLVRRWRIQAVLPIATRGLPYGANGDVRTDREVVIVARTQPDVERV